MDELAIKILMQFKNHPRPLNLYHFQILFPLKFSDKLEDKIYYLLKNGYISKEDQLFSDDKEVQIDTLFQITEKGEEFLYSNNKDSKRFKIQAIYVPITVSFITALLTTIITICLLPK